MPGPPQIPDVPAGAERLRLGEFVLDLRARRLLDAGGREIHLPPKPFAVLSFLVANRGRLVPRDELLHRFWGGPEVYDAALSRCVSSVRTALGDSETPARYIETHWSEGYRYIGPAEPARDAPPEPPPTASEPARARAPVPRRRVAIASLALLGLAAFAWVALRGAGPAAPELHRIGVLPVRGFLPERPWLNDALRERVIAALSRVEGLYVVVADDAPLAEPAASVARSEAYLTLSVAPQAAGLKLTARLTEAAAGRVLWATERDFTLDDLRGAEVELAAAVASQLAARLAVPEPPPRNAAAYDHVLRGRFLLGQLGPGSSEQALAEFEAALEADPDYAAAHAALAEALLALAWDGALEPRAAAERIAAAVARAGPRSARATGIAARLAIAAGDWAAAEARFAAAAALDPSDATVARWRAEAECLRGRFAPCRAGLERARELNPLAPATAVALADALRLTGDLDGAARELAAAERRWPALAILIEAQAHLAAARGEAARAGDGYEAVLPLLGPGAVGGPLVHARVAAGDLPRARQAYAAMIELAHRGHVSAAALAAAELALGEEAAAHASFARARAAGDPLATRLGADPRFAALADPR